MNYNWYKIEWSSEFEDDVNFDRYIISHNGAWEVFTWHNKYFLAIPEDQYLGAISVTAWFYNKLPYIMPIHVVKL